MENLGAISLYFLDQLSLSCVRRLWSRTNVYCCMSDLVIVIPACDNAPERDMEHGAGIAISHYIVFLRLIAFLWGK
jgi:hypothetical protein